MAVRFKIVKKIVIMPQYGFPFPIPVKTRVPIREWSVNPQTFRPKYTKGGDVPEAFTDITFPELNKWEHAKYGKVRYKISASLPTGENWLRLSAENLTGDTFTPDNLVSSRVHFVFQNLDALDRGIHQATVVVNAYGVDEHGDLHFIESGPAIDISLTVEGDGGVSSGIYTDKDVYNIRYNKSSEELEGEKVITIYNLRSQDFIPYADPPFNLSFIKEEALDPKRLLVTLIPDGINLEVGSYSKAWIFKTRRKWFEGHHINKIVTINLEVIDDSNDFNLTPKNFDFQISKSDVVDIQTGTVTINNPNNLNLSITASPSFLENVQINDNFLTFNTKSSASLNVGDYSGDIIVTGGSVSKKVRVNLQVSQGLQSDFTNKAYYFTLDGEKIIIPKTKSFSAYAKITANMYFKGYGEEHLETQEYVYPFISDSIEYRPGEDVQDFFIRIKDYYQQDGQYQYDLSPVSFLIQEYDADDNLISENRLNNIFFAPGKTPKCFPVFTDFPIRRYYPGSTVSFAHDCIRPNNDIKAVYNLSNYGEGMLEKGKFQVNKIWLYSDNFNEQPADLAGVELIPFPDTGNGVIHIFFENQNLVLDWFSCPNSFQKKFSFTHIFDDSNKTKFGSLETENIIINTGWILREEIELINAIIKSRLCFIVIRRPNEDEDEIITAKPISKKNEIYDTNSSKFNIDLEFNIKTDER